MFSIPWLHQNCFGSKTALCFPFFHSPSEHPLCLAVPVSKLYIECLQEGEYNLSSWLMGIQRGTVPKELLHPHLKLMHIIKQWTLNLRFLGILGVYTLHVEKRWIVHQRKNCDSLSAKTAANNSSYSCTHMLLLPSRGRTYFSFT